MESALDQKDLLELQEESRHQFRLTRAFLAWAIITFLLLDSLMPGRFADIDLEINIMTQVFMGIFSLLSMVLMQVLILRENSPRANDLEATSLVVLACCVLSMGLS